MRAALPIAMFLISQTFVLGQVQSYQIVYDGICPDMPSPHRANVSGNSGIKNPERGYSIRGGVFDIFSDTDYPNKPYYEDITGDNNLNILPLNDYLLNFEDDGISLIELEAYIHYKDNQTSPQASLNSSHLNLASTLIPETLNNLGVKTHLILNSSFVYNENASNGTNILEVNDNRYQKNLNYFNEAEGVFRALNPYVAIAHLGWIDTPWDFNQYRHSSNWKKSNSNVFTNYPIGNINNDSSFVNYHGTFRESVQRSSWGTVHNKASVWDYQSSINHLKNDVLNKTLNVFTDKKVLIKSTYAIPQYIGTAMGTTSPVYAITYPTNYVDYIMRGPETSAGQELPEEITGLLDENKYLRIGYYENAFGGDTYSHYWSIGNAYTHLIQWASDFSSNLGVDWANNPYHTDVHNLRKYRNNMWMHGEMPIYETEDSTVNKTQANNAWSTSSFNRHHQYFSNWYEGLDSIPNIQYDYEIGEGISSGQLQDGFYSALKLRYFNFTSFNISHNNLLDSRSPYEMPNGYDYSEDSTMENLVGDGIPLSENTAISGWKSKLLSKTELENFGMPISNNYFEDETGTVINRTAYDYIRDHLGYRLELQSTNFNVSSDQVSLTTSIVNRGFAAPQNKRKLYFVLMNSANELLDYYLTDEDWRIWTPDEFADGINLENNLEFPIQNATYNSMDELIIGGIPLGEYGSNWHHSPIHPSYSPYVYTVSGNFDISSLNDGEYKIGIVLPDNDSTLSTDGRFAVRFANQTQFIPCSGVTVLGHFTKGINQNIDYDGDGVNNNSDTEPYTPNSTSYTLAHLESTTPCPDFLQSIGISTFGTSKTNTISIFPNPVLDILRIETEQKWDKGEIRTINGQIVLSFNDDTNFIDLKHLKPGIFLITLKGKETTYIQKFIKK